MAEKKSKKALQNDNRYLRNIIETKLKPKVHNPGDPWEGELICPICDARADVHDVGCGSYQKWLYVDEPLKHKKHCYYAGREHTLP